jgi:hypothetical protein
MPWRSLRQQEVDPGCLTGPGTLYFEGGLALGQSPGAASMAGSTVFGEVNVYEADLGSGNSFDRYAVGGALKLGGTLKLASFEGFVGTAGERFDLFDWGTLEGSFAAIDASGLQLAPGTVLDTSRLYVDGSIAVQAVPEPATVVLWLIASAAWLARRWGAR